jgi:iron complex transport system permease protein
MKIKNNNYFKLSVLLILGICSTLAYLFINTRGNVNFALYIRTPKVIAFFWVAVCISFATIPFQTMTENHLLTPSIIGIDSLYIFFQTVTVFFFSHQSILNSNQVINFIVSTILVVTASIGLFYLFFKKYPGRILLMLLFGIVLGTLANSLNQFLQVIMDPNEFTITLSRTITSFNQVNTHLIWLTVILSFPCIVYLLLQNKVLDVVHLGRDYAKSLGIHVDRQYFKFFIVISVLTASATSLVGPISFLGFLGANVAYRLFTTYKHIILFIGSTLITFLFIIVGQTIVEHVFQTQTTLGVIIDFIGGLYFIFLLIKERS